MKILGITIGGTPKPPAPVDGRKKPRKSRGEKALEMQRRRYQAEMMELKLQEQRLALEKRRRELNEELDRGDGSIDLADLPGLNRKLKAVGLEIRSESSGKALDEDDGSFRSIIKDVAKSFGEGALAHIAAQKPTDAPAQIPQNAGGQTETEEQPVDMDAERLIADLMRMSPDLAANWLRTAPDQRAQQVAQMLVSTAESDLGNKINQLRLVAPRGAAALRMNLQWLIQVKRALAGGQAAAQ